MLEQIHVKHLVVNVRCDGLITGDETGDGPDVLAGLVFVRYAKPLKPQMNNQLIRHMPVLHFAA